MHDAGWHFPTRLVFKSYLIAASLYAAQSCMDHSFSLIDVRFVFAEKVVAVTSLHRSGIVRHQVVPESAGPGGWGAWAGRAGKRPASVRFAPTEVTLPRAMLAAPVLTSSPQAVCSAPLYTFAD